MRPPREEERPIPRDRPLVASAEYVLRVDIGMIAKDTIVAEAESAPLPSLPPEAANEEGGHWLSLVVVSSDFEVPGHAFRLYLPRVGASWTCSCPENEPHCCDATDRRPHVLIRVRAPARTGPASLRLVLYHRANAVQSHLLVADVAATANAPGAHVAHVDYTLSHDLADLARLSPRLLNILTNETGSGTHRLVFMDYGGEPLSFTFGEGQMTAAMDDARALLRDVHIDQVGNSRRNRLRPGNRKLPPEFARDLQTLAQHGWELWVSLFTEVQAPLLDAGRSRSRTIQVARVPRTQFVFPWSLVYDIPLDRTADARYELCPVVARWDGAGPFLDGDPWRCSHEDAHAKNTICPFGFWGFRYAIEHPASAPRGTLPTEVAIVGEANMVMARSTQLGADESRRHLAALRQALPGIAIAPADSLAHVARELADPDAEIVYFYCHGGRTPDGEASLIVGGGEQHPGVANHYLAARRLAAGALDADEAARAT